MEKTISVFINNVPTYSMTIDPHTKIQDLKEQLIKYDIVSMMLNKN